MDDGIYMPSRHPRCRCRSRACLHRRFFAALSRLLFPRFRPPRTISTSFIGQPTSRAMRTCCCSKRDRELDKKLRLQVRKLMRIPTRLQACTFYLFFNRFSMSPRGELNEVRKEGSGPAQCRPAISMLQAQHVPEMRAGGLCPAHVLASIWQHAAQMRPHCSSAMRGAALSSAGCGSGVGHLGRIAAGSGSRRVVFATFVPSQHACRVWLPWKSSALLSWRLIALLLCWLLSLSSASDTAPLS